MHQLLANYLKTRKQYVKLNNIKSDLLEITCGVPQGSILGPLLFLIYVNDIPAICENSIPFLFADDTNLIGFNKKGSVEFMQADTQRMYKWLCANKLSLNIGKSSTLTFNATSIQDLKCGNVPIAHATSCKYLGVRLDENLSFDEHITTVVTKLSKHAGIISKIRHYLPRKTVLLYYKQYVQPVIQYGLLIYGCTSESRLKPILVQQKKIVRLIYFLSRYDSSTRHFATLEMCNVYELYIFQILLFVTKSLRKEHPTSYLNNMFAINHQIAYPTRFVMNNFSRLPVCHKHLLQRSIKYRGHKLLNLIQQRQLIPRVTELTKPALKNSLLNFKRNYIVENGDLVSYIFTV